MTNLTITEPDAFSAIVDQAKAVVSLRDKIFSYANTQRIACGADTYPKESLNNRFFGTRRLPTTAAIYDTSRFAPAFAAV